MMIDPKSVPIFKGIRGEDEHQPSEFLRHFHILTYGVEDGEKVSFLKICLGPRDSPSREWYDELKAEQKGTWEGVEQLFMERFPDTVKAVKSKAEWEEELLTAKLEEEKVGKVEKEGGVEVYTHYLFAERISMLARKAGVASGSTLIGQVRSKLPRALRTRLKTEYPNWTDFVEAIKQIPAGELREEMALQEEKAKEERERIDRMVKERMGKSQEQSRWGPSKPTPDSPTKGIRQAMGNFQLGGQLGTLKAAGRGGGRLFPDATRPPIEQQRASIQELLKEFPLPANDAEYKAQLIKWRAKYGTDARVAYNVPYPLTPGKAPVASGECYRCGLKSNHDYANCQEPNKIPPREGDWRALCGRLLRRANPPLVNFLGSTASEDPEDFAWAWSPGSADYSPGKGKGSST
jgi:hypothetical protein